MSSKLIQVFGSLPPDAQRILVEKHLASLLDIVPKDRSKKILLAATQLQRQCNDAPKLDLRAMRKQIGALLDELTRDAKLAFIKERSNREELLAEIVHSLVSWINDIWTVVYEHHTNFSLAHNCLLYIAEALVQLSGNSSLGGCKCAVMNLAIHLELIDKRKKIVKHFSVVGPQNLDRILLWVWRDLFVSLLADGSETDKKRIPEFLDDIESSLGALALERLLYGGKSNDDESGEMDGIDSEDEEEEGNSEDEDIFGHHYCDNANGDDDDDDDDDDYYTDDDDDRCPCNFHAKYWPERLDRERTSLRQHVENRLFAIFELTPSLAVYNTLMNLSENAYQTDIKIEKILKKIAGDTPNNLVAALDIQIHNNDPEKIISLLDSYSYLLRPRDAVTLQCAIAMLDQSEYHKRGIAILEKEFIDCIHAIHSTVRSCFSRIEDEANRKDLQEILQLRNGSSERKSRVEAWGERVITVSNGPMHPMAFAAMMMGLPMMPGGDGDDDADILSYVDFDQDDPDLEELRDEYRPNLKAIFDGWNHIGQSLMGGSTVLARSYIKAVEIMPWLRASDVVSDMTSRLRERPNKAHVLDALVNLSAFAKLQRKKLNLARSDVQRRNNATTAGPSRNQSPGVSSSTPTSNTGGTTWSPSTRTTQAPVASSSTSSSSVPLPQPNFPPVFSRQSTSPFTAYAFGGPSSEPTTPPPMSAPFPPVPGGMEDVD